MPEGPQGLGCRNRPWPLTLLEGRSHSADNLLAVSSQITTNMSEVVEVAAPPAEQTEVVQAAKVGSVQSLSHPVDPTTHILALSLLPLRAGGGPRDGRGRCGVQP